MFTSTGHGISLSPGTLKRKQNPSLIVGKIEQAYRTKQIHQPIPSDPRPLLLCCSQVKKCVCLGKSEAKTNISDVCGIRLRWCDEELMSAAEAAKWVAGWDNSSLTYLVQWQSANYLLDLLLAFWTVSAYSWSGTTCSLTEVCSL